MKGISVLQAGKQAFFQVTGGVCIMRGERGISWMIRASEPLCVLSKNDVYDQFFRQPPPSLTLKRRLSSG